MERWRVTIITMLGIDPGMQHTGYAVADVDLAARQIIMVRDMGVLTTKRENCRQVRRSSDDLRRARSLRTRLDALTKRYRIDVAASEMASTAPFVRIALNFGIMLGVLSSFDFLLIELLPQDVKEAVTGNRSATKRDIVKWALGVPSEPGVRWPKAARPNKLELSHNGVEIANSGEHQADALAVIHAALHSEQLAGIVSLERAVASHRHA